MRRRGRYSLVRTAVQVPVVVPLDDDVGEDVGIAGGVEAGAGRGVEVRRCARRPPRSARRWPSGRGRSAGSACGRGRRDAMLDDPVLERVEPAGPPRAGSAATRAGRPPRSRAGRRTAAGSWPALESASIDAEPPRRSRPAIRRKIRARRGCPSRARAASRSSRLAPERQVELGRADAAAASPGPRSSCRGARGAPRRPARTTCDRLSMIASRAGRRPDPPPSRRLRGRRAPGPRATSDSVSSSSTGLVSSACRSSCWSSSVLACRISRLWRIWGARVCCWDSDLLERGVRHAQADHPAPAECHGSRQKAREMKQILCQLFAGGMRGRMGDAAKAKAKADRVLGGGGWDGGCARWG